MKPCFLLCLRVLASCVCCRQWSPGTRVHIHAKCLTGIWAVGQLAGCPWWLLNTAEVCWVRSVCFKLLLNLPKKVTTWTNIRFNLWANVHSGSFYFQWIYLQVWNVLEPLTFIVESCSPADDQQAKPDCQNETQGDRVHTEAVMQNLFSHTSSKHVKH